MRLRRVLLWSLAPLSALVVAVLLSSISILLIHQSPTTAFRQMFDYGSQTNSLISMVNRATPLYLSGLAVAIGFKMNLFNIGVEGQYKLAGLLAAAAGAAVHLPAPLHIALILVVAMGVGAMWAGLAGVLRVQRGVSEVISTIMLNFIAIGLVAYLLANYLRIPQAGSSLLIKTPEIPPSGQLPPLNDALGLGGPTYDPLFSFVLGAVVVGILYYIIVWRTRFGFDLRASGLNPDAARVSGISPSNMIVRTMLISGAIAGLVGMNDLLGFSHAYTLDFPQGYGFDGIAVALVGRNNPIGIAVAALLFGWIDRSAQILDLIGIPKEVIIITKGVIILSVVIAYELVRRVIQAQEVKVAAEKTREIEEKLEVAV
jgi:general nucleoside transport system permease protein